MIAQLVADWTLIALVVLAVGCVAVLVLAIQFGSPPQEGIMPTGRGKPGIMPPLWPDGQPERRLPVLERAQADLLERRRLNALVETHDGRHQ